MTELLTAARMRAIEDQTIASGRVTGLELMERAGQGVVDAALAHWPHLAAGGRRAVVLCGPGNNGGDGFVVARLLADRGWQVEVFLLGPPAALPPDAAANHARWCGIGQTRPLDARAGGVCGGFGAAPPDLIVDALFGTGLSRPLGGDVDQALVDITDWMHRRRTRVPVVAVDVPSGLCADSGRSMGAKLQAGLTVTFHRAKPGHYLADGPDVCGCVNVVDIGLPQGDEAVDERKAPLVLTEAPRLHQVDKASGHKFSHGHALVLSGGVGRGGAARLAARAALRIGAGLVTLGCPPSALIENAARLDAVMLRSIGDGDALAACLAGDVRIGAVCLGPGLGLGPREAGLVRALLLGTGGDLGTGGNARFAGAVVLDADALTHLSRDPALFAALDERCLLTPHGGEFARLFPDIAARLAAPATAGPAYSKVDATRDAARRAGCTVLYKGADTVISDPNGACAVHAAQYDLAAPWLATAGSGDVLAGIVTGLLARGIASMQAAQSGAWLHAAAARQFGPGLIAEDLPDQLPAVLRSLGA